MAEDGFPRVIPMLAYEDGAAALDWLTEAFGFRERTRYTEPDGTISHGELELGGGVVMLATPTPDYQGPKRHREECDTAARWSDVPWVVDGVLVEIAEIDRHFARAQGAGARMLSGIEDNPFGRLYRVEDLEGHRWMFIEPNGVDR